MHAVAVAGASGIVTYGDSASRTRLLRNLASKRDAERPVSRTGKGRRTQERPPRANTVSERAEEPPKGVTTAFGAAFTSGANEVSGAQ